MDNQQILDFTNKTEVRTTCHNAGDAVFKVESVCSVQGGLVGETIYLLPNGKYSLKGEQYHSLEGACRANARMCRRLFY